MKCVTLLGTAVVFAAIGAGMIAAGLQTPSPIAISGRLVSDEELSLVRGGDLSNKYCLPNAFTSCPGKACANPAVVGSVCIINCNSYLSPTCSTSGTGAPCVTTTLGFCNNLIVPILGDRGTCNVTGGCEIVVTGVSCGTYSTCP